MHPNKLNRIINNDPELRGLRTGVLRLKAINPKDKGIYMRWVKPELKKRIYGKYDKPTTLEIHAYFINWCGI